MRLLRPDFIGIRNDRCQAMKRRILIINFILIFLFLNNRYVFSSEEKKQRIVSLAPSTTEILFALGLDSEIVGVSLFCDYPLEAQEKEKIGTFSHPNIEKILSLRPDIVFCTGLEQAPIIKKLRQLKLEVYVSDPSNIKELFDSITEMAAFTNREEKAENLIEEMRRGIARIRSRVKSIPEKDRPHVFVEFWNNPLMTPGRGSFIDELITLAGGTNIAYDTERPYSYFSPEQVLNRDPDCIIVAYMVNEDASKAIRERLGWKEIAAVKNNRIYNDIDPSILLRPGPRLVEALTQLHKRLYP